MKQRASNDRHELLLVSESMDMPAFLVSISSTSPSSCKNTFQISAIYKIDVNLVVLSNIVEKKICSY